MAGPSIQISAGSSQLATPTRPVRPPHGKLAARMRALWLNMDVADLLAGYPVAVILPIQASDMGRYV
jgi:hypothetical protein